MGFNLCTIINTIFQCDLNVNSIQTLISDELFEFRFLGEILEGND